MKKVFFSAILIGAIGALVVLSCKKTNYNAGSAKSLSQLFAGLRTTPQTLSVTAGRDTIVFGASGTMFHFYTNSFKYASGSIITSGTVNLQLVEMYKLGEMVCNRASTMTSSELLSSGGEINIAATMNGQTVYANNYGIGFAQNRSSSQPMKLFFGDANNNDSLVTWTVADTTKPGTGSNGTISDSSLACGPCPKPWYYVFDSCKQFNAINCDCFIGGYGTLARTNVYVVTPDTSYNRTNTMVNIVFDSVYIRGALYGKVSATINVFDLSSHTFSLDEGQYGVPVGLPYRLMVITNQNGNYYFYQTSGVTTSDMTISAAMAPDTQGDIQSLLLGL